LLEGKTVNLRVAEREDADYLVECVNGRPWGEYAGISEQITISKGDVSRNSLFFLALFSALVCIFKQSNSSWGRCLFLRLPKNANRS
jgi:hypothetical protein